MNKVVSLLLSFVLVMGLAGCGTQTLDQISQQESFYAEQSESSAPTQAESLAAESESMQTGEVSASDESQSEVEEFDVADLDGEIQDFSKYQEVKKDKYFTDPVPEGQQKPVEPGEVEIDQNNQKTCYLTISCATILDNMDNLSEGKEVLVPADGMILAKTQVVFYEGESVFDVLQRETRQRKIHMESSFTPMYNSAYIEGIGNLYEFDCGSSSGWEYSVNGWFPNYGVSRYGVQQGDDVQFHYTCDLGRDLGADWMG